ncbi:MAG: hypothetical protein ABR878_06265 [Roseiarcus sp.]|jgi:hypothetical protein
MRPLVDSFCALAGVLVFSVAACASESQLDIHARTNEGVRAARFAVNCLGGVLNEDPAVNYLTVGDYPAQAAAPRGARRVFVCGDRIPPFILWRSGLRRR